MDGARSELGAPVGLSVNDLALPPEKPGQWLCDIIRVSQAAK